jgi:hypothetical protein
LADRHAETSGVSVLRERGDGRQKNRKLSTDWFIGTPDAMIKVKMSIGMANARPPLIRGLGRPAMPDVRRRGDGLPGI